MYRQGTSKDIFTEAMEDTVARVNDQLGAVFAEKVQTINDNFKNYENND
jgi:flavin-binding protein dodecin